MDHTREKHQHCDKAHCPICDGGLFSCTVCGGAEASLTEDCCGRQLTDKEQWAVQTGRLFYTERGGWKGEP